MRALISFLFLLIFPLTLQSQASKKDKLAESLKEYFAGIKKKYNYTRTWKSKLMIYRAFFPEFAGLLKDNASKRKGIGGFYFVGMSNGYLDLTAHIDFLEERLFEGQWQKASLLLIKKYMPKTYFIIYDLIVSAKLKYFNLYSGNRQIFMEKLFLKLSGIFAKRINENKKLSKETQVFLTGYLNTFVIYVSLNHFLDNRISLEEFMTLLLKTLRPEKKKK